METIKIKTNSQEYCVLAGENLIVFDNFDDADGKEVFLVVDDGVPKKNVEKIKKILDERSSKFHSITMEASEEKKSFSSLEEIHDSLIDLGYSRDCVLYAMGGGIICDMTGFAAATFQRGVDFVLIPTTLLSQVDAGVGGKLGIDFKNYKNQIGIFKEANTVIIDTKFLSTLSERELKSGFAEIIKHCLIKDSSKFDEISNNLEWEKNNWNDLVNHSIDIKSQVVKLDLKEVGFRKILNYGHTLGHAIETTYMSKQNKLLHGEAIAIGMICEAYISFYFNKLTKDELNKISNFITNIFNLQEINYFEEIIKHTFQDKKNVNQKIRTCVLNGIGDCEYDIEINPNLILDSLEYYNKIL